MKCASLKSFVFGVCRLLASCVEMGGLFVGKSPPLVSCRQVLGDVTGDPGNRVDDVAGEERECTENGDRNHGQHDAVLRHRLPVLTLERVKKLQHLIHLPSSDQAGLSARRRTTTSERNE